MYNFVAKERKGNYESNKEQFLPFPNAGYLYPLRKYFGVGEY